MESTLITVAHGNGIGPEIMDAVLTVLRESGARLDIETIEIGESVYRRGVNSGIEPSAWESLRRSKVFLKAPMTTPQGGGFKSLNVAIRSTLGLYANVRPCVSYHPFVTTKHPRMDVVIVRENEEDLYTGIEYRHTPDVIQALKLISRPGCERIIRYAFAYARANHRQKVTAFVKDNIMKLSDGLFHKIFHEIAQDYPDIKSDSLIIDIGAARLADTPEQFDVIVTLNLYGDIVSDIAAQIAGSVGLAGSSNIGEQVAMFEAIHGSAPSLAGRNIANPSGLLLAAVMMLVHIGQSEEATRVHNAWLRTIEDGIHTVDIFNRRVSRYRVGTRAFAESVIERLGQIPQTFDAVSYALPGAARSIQTRYLRSEMLPSLSLVRKDLVGVDVFLHYSATTDPDLLARALQPLAGPAFTLVMLANRGSKVWPEGAPETLRTDHWRCRFLASSAAPLPPRTHRDIAELLARLAASGYDFVQSSTLFCFDGHIGYSLLGGQ